MKIFLKIIARMLLFCFLTILTQVKNRNLIDKITLNGNNKQLSDFINTNAESEISNSEIAFLLSFNHDF